MREPLPACVFVYGTLQRGQSREGCWPHGPLEVHSARVRGRLCDLGPYPGLIAGEGWVRGELWRLAPQHVPRTLEVLDRIEGFAQPGQPDLYRREVIGVWGDADDLSAPPSQRAFAYFLADPRLLGAARPILPRFHAGRGCYAEWPASVAGP